MSHGFKPEEYEPIKNSSGYRFARYTIHECSLVSIPANENAVVLSLQTKSFESPAVQAWVKSIKKGSQMPDKTETPVLTAETIEKAVSDGMTKALATLTATAKGGDGAATGAGSGNGAGGTGEKRLTPAELLLKAAGGGGITVKSVATQYSGDTRTLKHFKTDESFKLPNGREPQTQSDLNAAKSGAYYKMLAKKAGIPVVLSEHEQELLELCYQDKWAGDFGGQYQGAEIDGTRMKTVLNDAVSGGQYASPYFVDIDLITRPVLTAEIFPYCDIRDIPRGAAVFGSSMQNPAVVWGTPEGTSLAPFDTSSLISAFDTTIFPVTAAITVGRDFLQDSPMNVGAAITEQIGLKLAESLDTVVAVGNRVRIANRHFRGVRSEHVQRGQYSEFLVRRPSMTTGYDVRN